MQSSPPSPEAQSATSAPSEARTSSTRPLGAEPHAPSSHDAPLTGLESGPSAPHHGAPGGKASRLGVLPRAIIVGVVLLVGAGVLAKKGAQREAKAAAPATVRDVPELSGKSITYSASFRDRAGLKVTTVKRAPLTPVLKLVGTVSFDPAHVAAAGSRIRGFVNKVSKVEGDAVEQGEALAEIESSELGQAQAEVAAVVANKKAAELNAARETDLLGRRLTTAREEEVARATLAQQRAMLAAAQQRVAALGGKSSGALGVYKVRAPIKGTVVERFISPGQSVEANLTTFRVADLDHLWIELAVFERDIGAVHVGDPVEIIALSDPDRRLRGRVAHVGEVVSLQTRSADVRVAFDNQERRVRPGQSVTAEVRTSGKLREALLIPASAMTYIDGKATVFVAEGEGKATPTEVKLGATDGVNIEVLEGLNEGVSVISEGTFALKSELFR
jgi:membrane fusion protein, heavy metal efflux system